MRGNWLYDFLVRCGNPHVFFHKGRSHYPSMVPPDIVLATSDELVARNRVDSVAIFSGSNNEDNEGEVEAFVAHRRLARGAYLFVRFGGARARRRPNRHIEQTPCPTAREGRSYRYTGAGQGISIPSQHSQYIPPWLAKIAYFRVYTLVCCRNSYFCAAIHMVCLC